MNARLRMLLAAGLAIGAIAVISAGCGGDDESSGSAANGTNTGASQESGSDSDTDSSSSPDSETQPSGAAVTTSSLSKAEFIKQGSAACVREGKNLVNEAEAYIQKSSTEEVAQGVALANVIKEIVLPTVEAQSAALRELGAPAGDEEEIEAILVAQQEGIDRARNLEQAQSTLVIEKYFADANKMLEDYGFTACIYG